MGDLPKERVRPSRPFSQSGVDYAGPYWLKTSRHRGYKSFKGYFIVFVCLCTKAVHLEAVSSYDSESFIAAFKRFVSRRGPCELLLSDNGRNFVGADGELRRMFRKGSQFNQTTELNLGTFSTTWKFNPPGAPHFGGIWEAAVRSVKHHLKRVIGDTIMTYEEFATLLCQIEACLNSRPLFPMSEDVSSLLVLTPAHFLIGETSFLITEPNLVQQNVSAMQRWRRTTQMLQRFWAHWSSDYLQQLQKRTKWKDEHPSLKVKDIVLMRNKLTAPTRWPLARVTALHPGSDGLVRVVDVQTASGSFQRPIHKLVKLFSEESQD